ncbi:MAG: threonine/serine dehydratase [Verrucomicrobia bacterium]|nr:threonine/serine dehydratase [Verrucomicrobiota bacterium]
MELVDIQKAQRAIAPYVRKTPLIRAFPIEECLKSDARIYLKCENFQITSSFKARGAFNALLNLSADAKKRGVVTRSSGNFAQALAYAGFVLNIPATIVMPENAPQVKKEKTAQYKPALLFRGPSQKEEQAEVERLASTEGLTPLSPHNHRDVIAGQGTIALEIFEDLPSVAQFFCPIGGGGIMAGTSIAFKSLNPDIHLVGIEPEGANDYYLSRQAGNPISLDKIDTIADGLRTPQVGSLNWPVLEKLLDEAATVTDEQIKAAMRLLYNAMGLIIEPSGAASVAGLLFKPDIRRHQGDIVCVLTGGNVDLDLFYSWL